MAVASGAEEELARLRQVVAQLGDTNREKALAAVRALLAFFAAAEPPAATRLQVFEDGVAKALLGSLCSRYDAVREASVDLFRAGTALRRGGRPQSELWAALAAGLLDRVDALPFKEQIEEIRVKIALALNELAEADAEVCSRSWEACAGACAALLSDKCPEAKRLAAVLVMRLSEKLAARMGCSARRLLGPLTANCAHQQTKIRRASLAALKAVLLCPGAAAAAPEALEKTRSLAEDRAEEIREEFYAFLGELLCALSYEEAKQMENALILELLTPLAPGSAVSSSAATAATALERYAQKKKAFVEDVSAAANAP